MLKMESLIRSVGKRLVVCVNKVQVTEVEYEICEDFLGSLPHCVNHL